MSNSLPLTALRGTSGSPSDQLAQGLGYLAIGLGLAQLLAPRSFCRLLDIAGHERIVRAYGVREIATGAAILTSHDPTPWIWGRVAGDAADLATLAVMRRAGDGQQRKTVGRALVAVAGIAAVDLLCARGLGAERGGSGAFAANYEDRSGFPRSPESMRGAARSAAGAGRRPASPVGLSRTPRLRIKESAMGRIVVDHPRDGHEFAFRVETIRGEQTLQALAPKWANGEEPSAGSRFVIEARDMAEREAVDQGWISL